MLFRSLVERLVRRTTDAGLARVMPLGALTVGLKGEALAELGNLARAGCVAFSQGNVPIVDLQVLLRAMQYAATFGYTLWLRPQEKTLTGEGIAHDGEVASRLGLPGIPAAAESVAIATALELARSTGVRLHFARLSTAAGVGMVRQARNEGLAVSCDVGIHHLHLTEMDIGYFDSAARFDPPLRAQRDRDALSAAVSEGVAAICSDHTPISGDGKQLPFGEAEAGATGLELLLPLTLKWAAAEKLPLAQALARITGDPSAGVQEAWVTYTGTEAPLHGLWTSADMAALRVGYRAASCRPARRSTPMSRTLPPHPLRRPRWTCPITASSMPCAPANTSSACGAACRTTTRWRPWPAPPSAGCCWTWSIRPTTWSRC